MPDRARVCFVVYCDMADRCQYHVGRIQCGTPIITYFHPERTGDHCAEFSAKPRDSQEPQP